MCRPTTPAAGVIATAPEPDCPPAASVASKPPNAAEGEARPYSVASARAASNAAPVPFAAADSVMYPFKEENADSLTRLILRNAIGEPGAPTPRADSYFIGGFVAGVTGMGNNGDMDGTGEELTGTAAFDAGHGAMPTWSELVEEHADSVYRLAFRLSGDQQDAEDLTQETFMRVFRSLKSYKPGTFEGWLHRITTNLFLDMVRHRSKIRMEALPEDYERVPGNEMTPEQVYSVSNLDPALQEALDELSPEFRVSVVLCDVVGMSYEEIAKTLGVKMGTVRSRIHRGRSQLRDSLEAKAATNEGARELIRAR